MDNVRKNITFPAILFWASLWGIVEATFGWLLHCAHVPGVGYILYPIALLCMTSAVSQTGRARSAVLVAFVAAAIKLFDLFLLGGRPFYYVTNPAAYIALEGCATAAFFHYVKFSETRNAIYYMRSFALGTLCFLGTFVAFKFWQAGMSAMVHYNPGVELFWQSSSIIPAVGQLLLKGAWLTVALYFYNRVFVKGGISQWRVSPSFAGVTAAIAVVITMVTF